MNAKRQTIWLVSMLSLMVVLSAYYLFTEDVNKLDMTTSGQTGDQVKVETKEQASGPDKATSGAVQSDAAKTASVADSKGGTKASSDAEVLKKLDAQGTATSGSDYFVAQQIQRNDNLGKQADALYAIINDSKKSSDEVSKAYDELSKLETKQEKMMGLEDELSKDYKNVIVNEDNGKWTVTVQADKLEKSQAVTIVDAMMTELGVTQDKVTVQFKS